MFFTTTTANKIKISVSWPRLLKQGLSVTTSPNCAN